MTADYVTNWCRGFYVCKSFELLLVVRRGNLAVSTRKITEEAAQVGAGPEWEGQRKEDISTVYCNVFTY